MARFGVSHDPLPRSLLERRRREVLEDCLRSTLRAGCDTTVFGCLVLLRMGRNSNGLKSFIFFFY